MVKQTFYDLKINSIKKETAGSSRIKFSLPNSLYEKFNHKPGQYISVRFNMKKEDYTRTYSISSEPNKNFIEIGVKHIENGMFSKFLKTKKVEDVVQISNPDGSFVVRNQNANHLLLIAAGSGITPIMSILKSTLRKNNKSRITLLYSNKTFADMMYKTEIQDLKDKYLERFLVFNFFSREIQSTEFLNGRITQDKIAFLSDKNLIDLEDLDQCFICGPIGMTKSLQSYLQDKGVAERKITTELFFVATDKSIQDISQNLEEGESKIELLMDGSKKSFHMSKNDDFIDKANQNGINVPYSCKNGMCATCRCKVSSGEAKMRKNYSLEEWEIKKGFVLSCQLIPLGKVISLDFDIM